MIEVTDEVYTEILGPDFTVVFTSGIDGAHSKKSKHYRGYALDVRTGHHWGIPLMSLQQAKDICERIQHGLGKKYYVVLESDHIHEQVRKRKGDI